MASPYYVQQHSPHGPPGVSSPSSPPYASPLHHRLHQQQQQQQLSSPYSTAASSPVVAPQQRTGFSGQYNPQQWGRIPDAGSESVVGAAGVGMTSMALGMSPVHGQHTSRTVLYAPRLTGPDEPMGSPPPPYSAEPASGSPATATDSNNAFSASTEYSHSSRPVSGASTGVSSDSLYVDTRSPASATSPQTNFPPPPPSLPSTSAASRVRSSSRNHADRFLAAMSLRGRNSSATHPQPLLNTNLPIGGPSTSNNTPISAVNSPGGPSAIETLQANTARILNPHAHHQQQQQQQQQPPILVPPSSRRAASAGAVSGPASYSVRSQHAYVESPVAQTPGGADRGFALPPPPPGPPPASSRSQSLSGRSNVHMDAPMPLRRLRQKPPPTSGRGGGTGLGPVPPTPANWTEENSDSSTPPPLAPSQSLLRPNGGYGGNNGNGGDTDDDDLNDETGSIQREPLSMSPTVANSSAIAAVPSSVHRSPSANPNSPTYAYHHQQQQQQQQQQHVRRDSTTGLIRAPAVRNRSAQGLRDRRSESRRGREMAASGTNGNGTSDSDVDPASPTSVNDALSRPLADLMLTGKGAENSIATRRQRRASARGTPKSATAFRGLDEALRSADSTGALNSAGALYTGGDGATPRGGFPQHQQQQQQHKKASPTSPASYRPVSHLLHDTSEQLNLRHAPLSPESTTSLMDADADGGVEGGAEADSEERAFAMRSVQRHRVFVQNEAAAGSDAERLRLFVEYMRRESRLRRERYSRVFEKGGIRVADLVRGLFGADGEERQREEGGGGGRGRGAGDGDGESGEYDDDEDEDEDEDGDDDDDKIVENGDSSRDQSEERMHMASTPTAAVMNRHHQQHQHQQHYQQYQQQGRSSFESSSRPSTADDSSALSRKPSTTTAASSDRPSMSSMAGTMTSATASTSIGGSVDDGGGIGGTAAAATLPPPPPPPGNKLPQLSLDTGVNDPRRRDYVPCLSPIASMSAVTRDEMDSRGRAPSRWWEGGSNPSRDGDGFRVLERSKRESKYMSTTIESAVGGASHHHVGGSVSASRAGYYDGTSGSNAHHHHHQQQRFASQQPIQQNGSRHNYNPSFNADNGFHQRDQPSQHHYGPDEYPPEKGAAAAAAASFDRHSTGFGSIAAATTNNPMPPPPPPGPPPRLPPTPDSASLIAPDSDKDKLDISRLITLPPPYPRRHPAVNNSHPHLMAERAVVRLLHDTAEEAEHMRTAYEAGAADTRARADSWMAHEREIHAREVAQGIERGELLDPEEFDAAQNALVAKLAAKTAEVVKTDLAAFTEKVSKPLKQLYAERVETASGAFGRLAKKEHSQATDHDGGVDGANGVDGNGRGGRADLTLAEGDAQPELLERLTMLKWLFEAREALLRAQHELETQRNERYMRVVLLPYEHPTSPVSPASAISSPSSSSPHGSGGGSSSATDDDLHRRSKVARETRAFFAADERARAARFAADAALRYESFLATLDRCATRGVEAALSAFWDIAPSMQEVLTRVPDSAGLIASVTGGIVPSNSSSSSAPSHHHRHGSFPRNGNSTASLSFAGVQVPRAELADDPVLWSHPLRYLYTVLAHAEASSRQFIEAQVSLWCLVQEVRESCVRARWKATTAAAEKNQQQQGGRGGSGDEGIDGDRGGGNGGGRGIRDGRDSRGSRDQVEREVKRGLDDLKDKVGAVEGQWVEGLGGEITRVRNAVRTTLEETGGWDDALEGGDE